MAPTALPLADSFSSPDAGIGSGSERGFQRVLMVCPPYQTLGLPSLATAQLATVLRANGVECKEAYVHFDMARLIGKAKYETICEIGSTLEGELLFAEALHGATANSQAESRLTSIFGPSGERRNIIDEMGQSFVRRLLGVKPDVVGLTTSFGQLLASLWIARLVKQNSPATRVVLGGSGCTEPMGQRLLDAYPEVDFVVSGFGEKPLLAIAQGEEPRRRLIKNHESPILDELPIPDYTGFLAEVGEFPGNLSVSLAFEASRGCWWGQKNHCTFCGLNGRELRATAKSSKRVVREVRELWERYQRNLYATDTMLAREHLRYAIPELAKYEEGPDLFFEVKSNMTEADLVALKRARVTTIQPGIESLSTHLLKLMNKGVTAIRNLALLKWCREQRMRILWNVLCMFPGESFEDYDQQLLLMDKIPHFYPPDRVKVIRMDRFSPYFEEYSKYGWSRVEPFPEYRWLHPQLSEDALCDIAYHFNGVGGIQPGPYVKRLEAARLEWIERHLQGDGLFLDPDRGLIRNVGPQGLDYGKNPVMLKMLDLTHEVAPVARVLAEAGCNRSALDHLEKNGIVYVEDDKVINLAVRTKPPATVPQQAAQAG